MFYFTSDKTNANTDWRQMNLDWNLAGDTI